MFFLREKEMPRQLLRYRAGALPDNSTGTKIGRKCTHDPGLVDTMVIEKIRIFRGNNRMLEIYGDLIKGDPAVTTQRMDKKRISLLIIGIDLGRLTENIIKIIRSLGNGRYDLI